MIDGAQAVQHMKVNVVDLDVDFIAFLDIKCTGLRVLVYCMAKEKY